MIKEQIHTFLEDFRKFDKGVKKLKLSSDLIKFNGLLSGYNSIQSLTDTYERKIASQYNIFYLLRNIYKDEERTHSPFLADLLNIRGEHKQGNIFYREFVNLLDVNDKEFYWPSFSYMQNVETERYTGDGSIDILISYHDGRKNFAIGIENKIYAGDQPNQLERYNAYLKSIYGDNYLLIYLSPYGHNPSIPFSIQQETYDNLHTNNKLLVLSYYKHIAEMLNNSLPKIEAPNIRQIIKQYYQTITNF